MFIENLRHVKKKNKVLMIILVALIGIGILSTFAYLGSSYNGSSASSSDSYLANIVNNYEASAKEYERTLKKTPEDLDALAGAANDYLVLAAYQDLLLNYKASNESYEKALGHTQNLLTAYGTAAEVTETQWADGYDLLIQCDLAMNNLQGARDAFMASWDCIGQNSDYVTNYANYLIALEEYDVAYTDVQSYYNTISEDQTDYQTAISSVLSTIQWQQLLAEYYASADTTATEGTEDAEDAESAEDADGAEDAETTEE